MSSLNCVQLGLTNRLYQEGTLRRGCAYAQDNPKVLLELFNPKCFYDDLTKMMKQEDEEGSALAISIPFMASEVVDQACTLFNVRTPSCLALILAIPLIALMNVLKIQESQKYLTWKSKHIVVVTEKSMNRFFVTDGYLNQFLCALSHRLPKWPAKGPDGKLYDRVVLIRFMKNHPGRSISTGVKATSINEFKFDYFVAGQIVNRTQDLYFETSAIIQKKTHNKEDTTVAVKVCDRAKKIRDDMKALIKNQADANKFSDKEMRSLRVRKFALWESPFRKATEPFAGMWCGTINGENASWQKLLKEDLESFSSTGKLSHYRIDQGDVPPPIDPQLINKGFELWRYKMPNQSDLRRVIKMLFTFDETPSKWRYFAIYIKEIPRYAN